MSNYNLVPRAIFDVSHACPIKVNVKVNISIYASSPPI